MRLLGDPSRMPIARRPDAERSAAVAISKIRLREPMVPSRQHDPSIDSRGHSASRGFTRVLSARSRNPEGRFHEGLK